MKYKLIIFDIDGTITRHPSSWQYLHEQLGLWDRICPYWEKFLARKKISYEKFCQFEARQWMGLPEKTLQKIFNKMLYSKNAVITIKRLKKMGFKLAAFSTGLQFLGIRIKKELGFDYVLTNALIARKGLITGGVKINIPHYAKGRFFSKAIRHFGLMSHEIICIGDSKGDIPVARRSGHSIAFNSSSKEFSKIADYCCRTKDFKEILKYIEKISFQQ